MAAATTTNPGITGDSGSPGYTGHPQIASASLPQTSLGRRAPTGPINTSEWTVSLGYVSKYERRIQQQNCCVRSRLESSFNTHSPNLDIDGLPGISVFPQLRNDSKATFPYPKVFQKMLTAEKRRQAQGQRRARVADEENQVGDVGGVELTPAVQDDAALDLGYAPERVSLGDGRYEGETTLLQNTRGLTIVNKNDDYEIRHESNVRTEIRIQPVYVVLGLFPRSHDDPKETIIFIRKPERLFLQIWWGTVRLRGLASTFLSLKHCDAKSGTHERITLDDKGVADLQVFLETYKKGRVPNHVIHAWSNWIYEVLNNKSHDVDNGGYSLEFELGWSSTRITNAVLLPLLLSLATGLWLNSRNWTDLTTIQTAWGTASYVVTAGGLFAALLAILSSIADK
ncbi:hypothetical protein ONZ43_g1382 [Nemania bipapillata]|uniref:Uncharacterized protein n=1 Tax=Nemania bipapillata TaxID=110536 RepID=A0ACC2J512_9PEZI|nr:hypothetical protein ONZ43_g1382 [Nemania bipapillata]